MDPGGAPPTAPNPGPYQAGQYPVTAVPAVPAVSAGYGGYGGYGAQPGGFYPVYLPIQKTNGLAIASMVVSIVGAVLLVCYGVGALFGVVGAILGHVARRQIRERQESGDGMALAGIITGWIATGLGLAFVAFVVIAFVLMARSTPIDSTYDSGFDALRLLLSVTAT